VAHPPYGKAVAEYPRTPDTQGQAAGDDYDFHAAVQHPDERADGAEELAPLGAEESLSVFGILQLIMNRLVPISD